jgi:uridine kinase
MESESSGSGLDTTELTIVLHSLSAALDIELMETTLDNLTNGRRTTIPVYDFITNARKKDEVTVVYPADVILIEGILAFYFESIRNRFNLKVFVDSDADIRLSRRGNLKKRSQY